MHEQITLTVNGEKHTAIVPARTQLAEIIRDHLELTGTHIGCEQGVCGACTVLMNGQPVRSCITFAHSCEGSEIETIEGFSSDPFMQKVMDAFSRYHALQCGFCTPGVLATAKDILTRFPSPDEGLVRHELSGNLCRCTGYQGMVQAIVDVGAQTGHGQTGHGQSSLEESNFRRPEPVPFTPFVPEEDQGPAREPGTRPAATVTQHGNWTAVDRTFLVNHPKQEVWALFSDISRVATCVPGATVSRVNDDTFSGHVEIAFGPVKARFAGDGNFRNNDDLQQGHISGKGTDKNGQSRVRGELHYTLMSGPSQSTTKVDMQFRFEIHGLLAQFNRPELVTGFVDFLMERFVANCHSVLSGGSTQGSHRIGIFELAFAIIKSFFRRIWK